MYICPTPWGRKQVEGVLWVYGWVWHSTRKTSCHQTLPKQIAGHGQQPEVQEDIWETFQKELKEVIQDINESTKMIVSADKTRNWLDLERDDHQKLVTVPCPLINSTLNKAKIEQFLLNKKSVEQKSFKQLVKFPKSHLNNLVNSTNKFYLTNC